jgi:hypothetical protein
MTQPPRIVVALDPASPQADALDLLTGLVGLDTDLLGLFVEDTRLLSHARSSLAREVVLGGVERALDLAALERQLRVRSADVRRHFESAARRFGGRHTFRVARGEVVEEIERAAVESELLVVCVARTRAGQRAWWGAGVHMLARSRRAMTVFARDTVPTKAPVVAVLTDIRDVPSVWGTAVRVARAENAPLTALLLANAPGEWSEMHEQLARDARGLGLPLRIATIGTRTAPTLRRVVGTTDACTLILAARDSDGDPDLVRELLAKTAWSLVLVRDPAAS